MQELRFEKVTTYSHWLCYFVNGDTDTFEYYADTEEEAEAAQAEADEWLANIAKYFEADHAEVVGDVDCSYFGYPDLDHWQGLKPGDVVQVEVQLF